MLCGMGLERLDNNLKRERSVFSGRFFYSNRFWFLVYGCSLGSDCFCLRRGNAQGWRLGLNFFVFLCVLCGFFSRKDAKGKGQRRQKAKGKGQRRQRKQRPQRIYPVNLIIHQNLPAGRQVPVQIFSSKGAKGKGQRGKGSKGQKAKGKRQRAKGKGRRPSHSSGFRYAIFFYSDEFAFLCLSETTQPTQCPTVAHFL